MSLNILLYARVLVPQDLRATDWDNRDGEYCPYVIIDDDPERLTNEALDAEWAAFIGELEEGYDGDFLEFVQWLEDRSYSVINVESGGVWCEPETIPPIASRLIEPLVTLG